MFSTKSILFNNIKVGALLLLIKSFFKTLSKNYNINVKKFLLLNVKIALFKLDVVISIIYTRASNSSKYFSQSFCNDFLPDKSHN